MNPPDRQQDAPQNMGQRIQRLIDGDLTAAELAALETELMESPEAMETYRAYLELDCALEEQIGSEQAVKNQPVVPVARILAMQRKLVIKVSMLGAAAIVLLTAVGMWFFQAPAQNLTLAKFEISPGSDFTLTHGGEADAPAGKTMAEGSRLILRHGVAELKLPHDVRAVVEAPAEMTLRDDRTLEFAHGRALFQVPTKDGRGFTVVTPHQRIVDLGTAFGVDCPKGRSEIELHVLEGRVRVDGKSGKRGEPIQAKRAVMLAGTRVLREIDHPTTGFLRELPPKIDMLVKEDFAAGLIAGQNYVIRMDPTVIRDLDGNDFGGIDDDATWNFTSTPNPIPVAVASYVYDGTAGPTDQPSAHRHPTTHPDDSNHFDPGNIKLTDGDADDINKGWMGGKYVGFKDDRDISNPQVTFDLGATQLMQTITLYSLRPPKSRPAKSIQLTVSTDGVTYSTPVEFTPTWSGQTKISTTLDLSAVAAARYYRLNFVNPDPWMHLSEVTFGAAATPWSIDIQTKLAKVQPSADPSQTMNTRDLSPPVIVAVYPADNSTCTESNGQLRIFFNEPIKFGSGRVYIQNVTNWDESKLIVGDRRLAIVDRVLTINPPIELKDGTGSPGWLAGWESRAPVTCLNPRGNGKWYDNDDLQDNSPSLGMRGSMRSPGMTSINQPIRREIGTITAESRYTVSAAIGVRASDAQNPSTFPGYTIRLSSGDTVLAQLTDNTPPGPANSVHTVGFSWDAASLPDGVQSGDPLTIEITPNQTSGYLDLNALRISVLGKTGR